MTAPHKTLESPDGLAGQSLGAARGSAHRIAYDTRNEDTTDVWLSPPWLIKALGDFDLDPCAPKVRPWEIAKHHYTIEDDGLAKKWEGRIWLNPPYGNATAKWMKRLREHGNGIAFIYTRTETKMFFEDVWPTADAIFFFKGRIACHRPDGTLNSSPATASCLIAYGQQNVEAIRRANLDGQLVLRVWAYAPNDQAHL